MRTKFTPIVKFKKNELDKSEERVQSALLKLRQEEVQLQNGYALLLQINQPTSGTITEYRSTQLLLNRQREIINKIAKNIEELQEALEVAKREQKENYIEFEKYKYLESEEVKKLLKELQKKEAKELDEVALQSFMNKRLSS